VDQTRAIMRGRKRMIDRLSDEIDQAEDIEAFRAEA
jgi:hypothetical protein